MKQVQNVNLRVLKPDGEPSVRATGKGASEVKRRPNVGTLPTPHQIHTPGTCGLRARAKESGVPRGGRGGSEHSDPASRRQPSLPGPHHRGGISL